MSVTLSKQIGTEFNTKKVINDIFSKALSLCIILLSSSLYNKLVNYKTNTQANDSQGVFHHIWLHLMELSSKSLDVKMDQTNSCQEVLVVDFLKHHRQNLVVNVFLLEYRLN